MKLAFLGHVNIDRIISVRSIPASGSQEVIASREVYGGTAGNFALVAARLGLSFDLYSAVSPPTHAAYLEVLDRLGVDCSLLDTSGTSGPVCTIVSDTNEQIALMDQGPMNSWNPSKSFRYDRKYDWIHFSTGPPNEYIAIAKTAVGGSRITFDPGQEINYMYSRNNLEEFLSLSSLVIANSSEIQKMSSIMDMTPDRMLEEFPDYIITRGAEGVTYSFNGRERHMEAVPATRVVDTVGAGDAFRAGFYYGLNAGDTPEESIKVGQIVASKVVSSSPVDFRREMIKDILD